MWTKIKIGISALLSIYVLREKNKSVIYRQSRSGCGKTVPELLKTASQPVNNIYIIVPVTIRKVKKSGRGLGVV